MSDEKIKLAGSWLPILPGESGVSVQLRIAFSNGFKGTEYRRYFFESTNTRTVARLISRNKYPVAQGAAQLGLPAPPDERAVLEGCASILGSLFDTNFKYCSSCLSGGYHSFWHQMRHVKQCPIHDTKLLRSCAICYEPLPEWRNALRCVGYKCPFCAAPLKGATRRYRDLLRSRPREDELLRAFNSFQAWADNVRGSRVIELCTDLQNYSIFVDANDEVRSLVSQYGMHMPREQFNQGTVVIGVLADDGGDIELAGNRPRDFPRELASMREIYLRARNSILNHNLKNIDISSLSTICEKIAIADVVDYGSDDARVFALALTDMFFDLEARIYGPSRGWARVSSALGWVSQPVCSEVRHVPEAWFCVVLSVFGMAYEIVRLIISDNSRRNMLDIVIGSVVSENTAVRLTRGMVRDLIFASVPLISMNLNSPTNLATKSAIILRVVQFEGLETIIREEGILSFDEIVGMAR